MADEEWIEWARTGRAHGLRGELRLFIHNPQSEHIADVDQVRLVTEAGTVDSRIVALRPGPNGAIARFRGVDDRNGADRLRNARVLVPASLFPPAAHDDAEFYAFELEGLDAVDPTGKRVGKVESIVDFGAGDLLAIRRGAEVDFLPFAAPYVGEIDLDAGTVVVDPGEFAD